MTMSQGMFGNHKKCSKHIMTCRADKQLSDNGNTSVFEIIITLNKVDCPFETNLLSVVVLNG